MSTARGWLVVMCACTGQVSETIEAGTSIALDASVVDAGADDAGTPRDAGHFGQWGQGAELGSMTGDVWSPGRDSTGTVNEASWNLVPHGRWVSVTGTRLDSLDSVVKAALPGWKDYGSSDWNGVTEAWNAPAVDLEGLRVWRHGGGHGDSSNNGIYRVELTRMTWAIEHLPSDTTLWSQAYQNVGTYAACPESQAAYDAEKADGGWAQRDHWYYDEVFWDRTSTRPIGSPTARHVYDGFIYIPSTNELIVACRRLWRYSLTTGQWTVKNHPSPAGDGSVMTEEIIAVLDQQTNRLILGSCGSGGPWSGDYDLKTDTWLPSVSTWGSWDWSGGPYTRDGDVVTIFQPPQSAGSYASIGRWQRYHALTHTVLSSGTTFQYAGGLSLQSFPDTDHSTDGHAMVYVRSDDVYWVYTKFNNAMGWLELDLKTTPATLKPKTFANAAPALPSGIGKRRVIYFPAIDAIVWFSEGDHDLLVYRL